MRWNAFLRVGAGIALGAALAACGGGGHDGGKVDPEPQPARAYASHIGARVTIRTTRFLQYWHYYKPDHRKGALCRLNSLENTKSTIRASG